MLHSADALFDKIVQGDRVALGKAMTLIESERPGDRQTAIALLERCDRDQPAASPHVCFAVSGAPGAGKSTLIETLGLRALQDGFRVGVLTIDPTSAISHGSILGDKSRMTRLSNEPKAFIRSTAAGTTLGGVARRTPELITLLSAAGYDLILMETVGVGQSEHIAWQFTDGFILVIQPGGGDELQGIKRGITELADIVIVNKADGPMVELARLTQSQYQQALHFFSPTRNGWSPKIVTCSAIFGNGIDEAWETIRLYQKNVVENPLHPIERLKQHKAWLTWSLGQTARTLIMEHPRIREKLLTALAKDTADHPSWYSIEYEIENLMRTLIETKDQNAETAGHI